MNIFWEKNINKQTKFSRDWRNFNKERFEYEIQNLCWDDVTSPNIDTNTSFSNFFNKINDLLDEMAPIKKLTKKEKGLMERPWITSDISNSIRCRNTLHKEFLDEKDPMLK